MANLKDILVMFKTIFASFNARLVRIEDHQIITNREQNAKLDRIIALLEQNGSQKENPSGLIVDH